MNGRRILIVDDDAAIGAAMSRILEAEGYSTAVAAEPAAALEFLRSAEAPFSAAILDLNLRHMTGEALAVQIHRIDPALPLIAVTGMALPGLSGKQIEGGFAAALQKPFRIEELLQTLTDHHRQR